MNRIKDIISNYKLDIEVKGGPYDTNQGKEQYKHLKRKDTLVGTLDLNFYTPVDVVKVC